MEYDEAKPCDYTHNQTMSIDCNVDNGKKLNEYNWGAKPCDYTHNTQC